MSNYLVDGADLTSVANAIRTKGGTSGQLAFPQGFVDAIDAIQTSGGAEWTTRGVLMRTEPSGRIVIDGYVPQSTALQNNTGITQLVLQNISKTGSYEGLFSKITNLSSVLIKNVGTNLLGKGFLDDKKLTVADLDSSTIVANQFYNCTALGTIIMRSPSIVSLGATNALQNTKMWSGKAGGTIYIPQALYEHLGDGTALDYQAATNWSTIHGYGKTTWAQIEGSIYETQYADGTPIPTT